MPEAEIRTCAFCRKKIARTARRGPWRLYIGLGVGSAKCASAPAKAGGQHRPE